MGSVGTNTSTSAPFDWNAYVNDHTKAEIAAEFKRQQNIDIKQDVLNSLRKDALATVLTDVSALSDEFERDWGFRPIAHIERTNYKGAYEQADWYAKPDNFGLQINPSAVNEDPWYFRQSTVHEFGHLVAGRYAYDVASNTREWYNMLRNEDNSIHPDPSPRSANYTAWNTQYAKDIVKRALSNTEDYKQGYSESKARTESRREQAAINYVVGKRVSDYAKASYHEAIAESFARVYTGYGNEISNAIVNEMKRMYKERKLVK